MLISLNKKKTQYSPFSSDTVKKTESAPSLLFTALMVEDIQLVFNPNFSKRQSSSQTDRFVATIVSMLSSSRNYFLERSFSRRSGNLSKRSNRILIIITADFMSKKNSGDIKNCRSWPILAGSGWYLGILVSLGPFFSVFGDLGQFSGS